ncbi:GNAT family N-acetyltransferase [Pseudoxanthomonas sp. 22568]|uniref:GNAT family N-acetyltransferase n=1 Tax=Pseudoxanthomonas TaxID=83618 RepID=UPI00193C76B9|nr:GNAT family N-acetyltransferase [Pseudoxanthomonas beigongshangi]UBB26547.1 GNAT family N-acetyltransferase [Pseudoxanthomonas japonensis]
MSIFDLRLETERLWLRPQRREDYEAWAAFVADEEATRYIGGVQPPPMAYRSLAAMVGCWQMEGFAMFSVIEKSSGRWVGRVGPWCPLGWPGTEIGWSIAREAWGHGYAPEAARAAADWAFERLGWQEIIHTIDPDNQNSKVVAAKLGSRFLRMGELPAPHEGKPVEIWGQSREQWFARGGKTA